MFKPCLALTLAAALAAPALAQTPAPAGWAPLFNGKDLSGWTAHWAKPPLDDRPASAMFTVENGMIHTYASDVAGTPQQQAYIQTDGDYSNYRLSLEYKWGEKKFPPRMDLVRDAGVVYHNYADNPLNWPRGIEAQIEEGDTGDLWGVSAKASSTILRETERYAPAAQGGEPVTVGVWGSFQRIRHGALNEMPGQWNTLEIIVKGDTATHIVNGFVNMRAWDFKQRNDAGDWVRLDHGKISLQAEFSEIYYRNVRIRPLTAEEMK